MSKSICVLCVCLKERLQYIFCTIFRFLEHLKMDNLDRFVFILLVVFNIALAAHGQDVCVKKGPCVCEFSNGTGIDLSPTAKSTFYSAPIFSNQTDGKAVELTTYYFHPCYDLVPAPPMNRSSANDTCNQPLAICRNTYTLQFNDTAQMYKMDPGVYNFMGNSNDTTFTSGGESIIFKNPPSETIVLLYCAQSEDKLHVASTEEPNKIVLAFYSRSACLRKISDPDEGRSFGSTLLIIFFSFVVFYLVLGICTKRFLMGATGIEVIPNLGFWSDLPNLVKDGWAFTINGFKLRARGSGPALSPDPNSYDSI